MIPAHNIRGNKTTRMPRRWLFLDTESQAAGEGGRSVQTFRLAVTAFDDFDNYTAKRKPTVWLRHESTEALASYLRSLPRARQRLILCCHNLAFDLRIGRLFGALCSPSWTLSRPAMHDRSVSVTWKRSDGASIVGVDSYAWLPHALSRIGEMIGMEKLPDPDPEDELGWWDRCERDVEIMRTAMLGLADWVEADDLGTWQKTGAGQSWSTWRHKFLTHPPLVHEDETIRELERESTFAARCEAWQHGNLGGRKWYYFDLHLSYAHICRDTSLPIRLHGTVRSHEDRPWFDPTGRRRWLYLADVETEHPLLPVQGPDGILWPAGSFSGWYWDRELWCAKQFGAAVKVREAIEYGAAPAMQAFADWAIKLVDGTPLDRTAVQAAAVKHWTRAIVGKTAARYEAWVELTTAPDDLVHLERVYDQDLGRCARLMTAGGRAWWADHDEYGMDAIPAIQSAIVSEGRTRLWRLMVLAGLENVSYVDTDGLWVNLAGRARLRKAMAENDLWSLVEKDSCDDLLVEGPRQIRFHETDRYAGIPRAAVRVSEHEFRGEKWESLTEAWSSGHLDRVVVTEAVWRPVGVDKRRRHLSRGRTEAYRIGEEA